MQVMNLRTLRWRAPGLDDNCTRVVESGELSENCSYLLLQPVGKQLSQDESLETLVKVFLDSLLLLYCCCMRRCTWPGHGQ